MKRIFAIAMLGLVLSAHKCNKGSDAASASAGSPLDKAWTLSTLNGKPVEMPDGAKTPWVQLAGDQLSGFGGCNNLMGSFTMDGSRIGFPGLGSTKMFCANTSDIEKSFMEALRSTDSYKMEGGVLSLMKGSAEVATLKAQ